MAVVRQVLELDLRKALSDVQTLERGIDDLREPITIPIDLRGEAVRDIRTIDERLDDIEAGAAEVTRELVGMELAAGRAVADFSRLATELNISEGEAEELTRDILEARNASERTADAARDVARQLGLSEDDARRFASEVGKGASRMDDLDRETRKVGDSVSKLRTGFGRLVLAAGAFIGIRELGQFAADSIKAFSGLQESTSKANVVFGTFADTVFEFTENAPTQLGNTRAAAIEMAASFGNLFLSVGLGQESAAGMSTTLVQLGSDLASFNNISVEEALEKLRSGLVGQAEPLRTVGVLLSETAVALKGVELGLGDANGKLSEAEKVQARYAIILEQTVTAQGDFARTSDGIANSSRTAAALFGELKTTIGEALAPAFAELIRQAPQIIEGFEGMVPGIAAAALALADFFAPKPGQADMFDFLNLLFDLPRGLSVVGGAAKSVGVELEGINRAIGAAFALDPAGFIKAIQDVDAEMSKFQQDTLEAINLQGFVDDLRIGLDAATELAKRLAQVGAKGTLDPKFVKDMVLISGLDFNGATTVLATLINDRARLGLAADDVEAVRIALAGVLDSARADGPIRNVTERLERLGEVAEREVVPPLEAAAIAAGTAERSFVELLTSTDPLVTAWRDMLTPVQDLQLTLDALGEDVGIAAGLFRDSLLPSIIDATEAAQNFGTDGKLSLQEFITGLRETETAARNFRTNMGIILAENAAAFAALLELPVEVAAPIAAELVADPARIEEFAAAVVGDRAALAKEINDIVQEAVDIARRDPIEAQRFITGESLLFTSEELKEELIARFDAGIKAATNPITGLIQNALDASMADLGPVPFTPIMVDSIEGLNQAQITASLDEALDASMADVELADPTNLFLDALDGMDSAALAAAVQEAIFADVRPVIDLSKTTFVGSLPGFGVGGGPGGVGGGVTVVNNIYNPTTTDLPTNTAQANQSTAATATLLNQTTSGGPH